jgi:hypothetical protein
MISHNMEEWKASIFLFVRLIRVPTGSGIFRYLSVYSRICNLTRGNWFRKVMHPRKGGSRHTTVIDNSSIIYAKVKDNS